MNTMNENTHTHKVRTNETNYNTSNVTYKRTPSTYAYVHSYKTKFNSGETNYNTYVVQAMLRINERNDITYTYLNTYFKQSYAPNHDTFMYIDVVTHKDSYKRKKDI